MIYALYDLLTFKYPEEAEDIFWALQFDPFSRDFVNQNKLFSALADRIPQDITSWRVGKIALLAAAMKEFQIKWGDEDYYSTLLFALHQETREVDDLANFSQSANCFTEIGLRALELFHLSSTSEMSNGSILKNIYPHLQNPDDLNFRKWFSILVSYSGLLHNPSEFAYALIEDHENQVHLTLAILVLCSNYFGTMNLVEQFDLLFNKVSLPSKVFTIRFLYQHGKNALANELSNRLRDQMETKFKSNSKKDQIFPQSEILFSEYSRSSLALFAISSSETNDNYYAGEQISNEKRLQESYSKLFQDEGSYSTEFQMELDSLAINSKKSENGSEINKTVETPFSFVMQSQHFSKVGEVEKAQYFAEKAIENLEYVFGNHSLSLVPRYIKKFQFAHLVRILHKIGFPSLAMQAADEILRSFPCDSNTHRALRDLYQDQGDNYRALCHSITALALKPKETEDFLTISELFCRLSEEAKAFQYFVLYWQSTNNKMTVDDQIKYCELALKAKQFDTALEIAEQLLNSQEKEFEINKLMGRIQLKSGNHELASRYFASANEIFDGDVENVIYLSRVNAVLESGSDIMILERGLSTFPESAAINVELAQKYYSQGLNADAIPFLERAKSLQPDIRDCVFIIGQLLVMIGDHSDAIDYYQKAFEKYRYDAVIGRELLRVALNSGDFSVASNCLYKLKLNFIPDSEDELLIARTVYEGQSPVLSQGFHCGYKQVKEVYQDLIATVVSGDQNPDLLLLFAESAAFLDYYDCAISFYLHLLENTVHHASKWRVQGGLGYVSLKMGHYETAIANLKEAMIDRFSEIKLGKLLAEALTKTGLEDDAMYYARDFYNKIPETEAAVTWYADICSKFGNYDEAISVLLVACQESPDNLEYSIHLAELMLKNQQENDTLIILESFLELNLTDAAQCWRITKLYMQLKDWSSARIFIERHLEKLGAKYQSIYFALSYLYLQFGDMDVAFEYSQKAIDCAVNDERLYIYQSDLHYLMGRPEAALSCLDFASQLVQIGEAHQTDDHLSEIAKTFISSQWETGFETVRGIELRRLFQLAKVSKSKEALNLAGRLLLDWRKDEMLKFLIVSLSLMNGDIKRATFMLENLGEIENKFLRSAFLSLKIEILVLTNRYSELEKIFCEDWLKLTLTPQILAARSVIALNHSSWSESKSLFDQALYWNQDKKDSSLAEGNSISVGYNIVEDMLFDHPGSLIMAATKLFLWEDASNLIKKYAGQRTRADQSLSCINGILAHAEWSYVCDELEIADHHPSKAVYEFDLAQFVISTLERLASELTGLKLDRWVTCANLVFSIGELDFSIIGRTLNLPEDVEFLLGALRWHGFYDKAAEVSERLSTHIKNPWQRALCYQQKDRNTGLQIALSGIEDRQNSPISNYVVAKYAFELDEFNTAYECIVKALAYWPNEPKWNFLASEIAQTLEQYEDRIAYLSQAFKSDMTNLQYAFLLCDEYQQAELHEEAIKALTKVRQYASQSIRFWAKYSEAHLLNGEKEKAFEYAEKMRSLAPESFEPYLHLAKISASIKEYEAALAYAQTAYEKNPGEPEVLILLSEIFEWTDTIAEAETLLEKAILAGQADAKLIIRYAIVKRKRHGSQSIIGLLEELRTEEGKNPQLFSLMTEVYMDCGEFTKAEEVALSAIKLKPHNPKVKLLLGKLKRINGQLDLAVHYISEAILDDAQLLEAYLELASIFQERRETDQAILVFKKAISAIPENYKPYYYAGLLFQENKDFFEAETMLKRAAELSPEDITIRRKLSAVVALNLVHNKQEV